MQCLEEFMGTEKENLSFSSSSFLRSNFHVTASKLPRQAQDRQKQEIEERKRFSGRALPAHRWGGRAGWLSTEARCGQLRGLQRCEKRHVVFEFSLCLSRACLGKMIVFIYKWLKNAVFRRNGIRRGPGRCCKNIFCLERPFCWRQTLRFSHYDE